PEPPPDAFDFYAAFAAEAAGPIHEPMCGSGRFLLPLLAQGFDISGSDTSPHMLGACRVHAAARNLHPTLTEQSLLDLRCSPPPRLLLIPAGSFGLLIDDDSVTAALARLHQSLAPGGTLLLEAERLLPSQPQTSGVWGGRWVE